MRFYCNIVFIISELKFSGFLPDKQHLDDNLLMNRLHMLINSLEGVRQTIVVFGFMFFLT